MGPYGEPTSDAFSMLGKVEWFGNTLINLVTQVLILHLGSITYMRTDPQHCSIPDQVHSDI